MPKQYYQEYSTRPTRGFHFHLLARGSTNPKRDDTTGFVREDCPPYARRPPGDRPSACPLWILFLLMRIVILKRNPRS